MQAEASSSTTNMESIEDLAHRWLELDEDPSTRKEIEDLLKAKENANAELEERLRTPIAFGTAGLRSSMKAGFAHMNSLTVLRASYGLAQYIIDFQRDPGFRWTTALTVVIGYDARHNSEKFARLSAAAFMDKGFQVLLFDRVVHTPLVPYTIKSFGANAGVMITASHNPKADNGYKVYWKNQSQIIPPHDAGIAAAISKVDDIISWDDSRKTVPGAFDAVNESYIEAIARLLSIGTQGRPITPFVYTPMHGVGLPFMEQVAAEIPGCLKAMHIVEAQAHPDPEFPTVPFPNPEEKGALDLAKAEAERTGCSIIIANDPDADRFAAAERMEDGRWHQFTGNQMGILLASYMFETYKGDKPKMAMLASTVSSRMLAVMAAKEGFIFRETLTGFKWLGNVAQELIEYRGFDPCFAYEEAIGYMFPSVVWDKDGIAAAAVFLTASSVWKEQGLTPWSKLQQLYKAYGYFEEANTYLISPSPDVTNKVFNDIRQLNKGTWPDRVGSRIIRRWRDLTTGVDSGTISGKPVLPTDRAAQMITCVLGGVVFTARGSGTEPKIKLYIEAQADSSAEAKAMADEVLQDLLKEWFKPKYGLKLAGT